MLGVDADLVLIEESARALDKGLVQRIGTAKRQRQPVTDEGKPFSVFAQFPAQPAADTDPVVRRDLHEVDQRQVVVVKRASRARLRPSPAPLTWGLL